MTMEFLIVALFAVSLLTNLTVEGIRSPADSATEITTAVTAAITFDE